MAVHPLAGKPVPESLLPNIPRLMTAYYSNKPDVSDPAQQVAFGTSGHRGISLKSSFNENHILAITQAVCEYRSQKNIKGPLYIGMDTHALSEAALVTALEVLAANQVTTMVQEGLDYTPTPVISHALLCYNKDKGDISEPYLTSDLADGIVITPSHNPPDNGGFKYNPPQGGPANTETTKHIQTRANELLADGLKDVKRIPIERALKADTTIFYDYIRPYIADLNNILDMEAIKQSGLKIGVDPLGGSGLHFWEPLAEKYGLNIDVVNKHLDPTFRFMRLDKDGVIRMDCSSPYAMRGLIELRERFDVAVGNDPDYDRHGIVTKEGLMNPNSYLSVAIWYLFQNRPHWPKSAAVGKTLVSSGMIDRVAASLGRRLCEVPVGFKWFVDGLLDGSYGFGGEESAGASFLRKNGTVWTTDKDGFIMDLLAAEIIARTGKSPAEHYAALEEQFGSPLYVRNQAPVNAMQKTLLSSLSPDSVAASTLAGETILEKLTHAPANGASIGGLKVRTENGWFAARPSGTEDIYKIYAESFKGAEHLKQIEQEAEKIVTQAIQA